MKTFRFTLTAFAVAFSAILFGQTVSQGNFIADLYYGGPNMGKSIAKSLNGGTSVEGLKGIGPTGARFEYMVSNKVGVGADIIYNSLAGSVQYDSTNADGTIYKTYTGTLTASRLRVMARVNFHLESSNPNLDSYIGFGAGSNTRFWKVTSDDPDFQDDKVSATGALLPVSFRLCTGLRYYFTPNIGLNAEIGLGGPVFSGGLSVKF